MQNTSKLIFTGTNERVGSLEIARSLPNKHVRSVGPFVFLDHILPVALKPQPARPLNGAMAHPHKGIATVSYSLHGEFTHVDSLGNQGVVSDGGMQWMNAGNGIIHDGDLTTDFQRTGGLVNALQFWINLPSQQKHKPASYIQIDTKDLPELILDNNGGALRVLIGNYHGSVSIIPTFSEQFLFHLNLKAHSTFKLDTIARFEYAAYSANGPIQINGKNLEASSLLVFNSDGDEITFHNPGEDEIDVMIFGGEPYNEPIVFGGNFVMNSAEEVQDAYAQYMRNEFGAISYDTTNNTTN